MRWVGFVGIKSARSLEWVEEESKKRRGRPKKEGKASIYQNGWYMLVDPRSGRILGVQPMVEPENNEIKITTLERILPLYPKCDAYIHDIAC